MKSLLLALLAAGLFGSAYWNYRQALSLRSEHEQVSRLRAQVEDLKATVKKEALALLQAADSSRRALNELQARVAAQKQRTDVAFQQLQDARANLRESQDPASARDDLRQEKAYIAELEANLKSVRKNEAAIRAQGADAGAREKWQQAQDTAALDARIVAQQKLVQESADKVNGLKGRRDYIGQQDLIAAREELKTRKEALQQLKDQKKALGQEWNLQRSAAQGGEQARRAELKASESRIEQTLQQEKSRVQAMSQVVNEGQRGRQQREEELKRLDAEWRTEKAKLDELQGELSALQKAATGGR